MKSILSICILLFIVEAAFGKEKVCEPGTHWKEDCNSCFCTKNGTAKACTLMLCRPTEIKTEKVTKMCEPNSHFKDKCNYCRCSNDGTMAVCTRMACPEGP